MTEAEALPFFLKLICAACILWMAIAWLILGFLYRQIRRRRHARERAAVIQISK